jgi:hypothetical protein
MGAGAMRRSLVMASRALLTAAVLALRSPGALEPAQPNAHPDILGKWRDGFHPKSRHVLSVRAWSAPKKETHTLSPH